MMTTHRPFGRPDAIERRVSRRTVVQGAAWAAPAVTVGAAAPTLAASTPPAIGAYAWVQRSCSNGNQGGTISLTFDSRPTRDSNNDPTQGFWITNGTASNVTSQACRVIFLATKYGKSLAWSYADTNADNRKWSLPTYDSTYDSVHSGYYGYKSCYSLTGTAGWSNYTGSSGSYTIATYGGYFTVSLPGASASECNGSGGFQWCGERYVTYGGRNLTYGRCRTI